MGFDSRLFDRSRQAKEQYLGKEFSDTGSEELSKINCIEVDAIAGQ